MDEILIEDKRYISSKRAAKLTGYAKDYVGQLCREGRVPARLVGRSWYVLESAIHDHRFTQETSSVHKESVTKSNTAPARTWESPRYEAFPAEALPSVNRLKEEVVSLEQPIEHVDISQHLQDSWKAWFDRVAETPVDLATLAEPEDQSVLEEKAIEEEIAIPIRTIYELPPEDLLPSRQPEHHTARLSPDDEEVQRQKEGRGVLIRGLQLGSAVFAVSLAVLAIIGTGYFDKYFISNSPVSFIAGVAFYNR